MIEYGQAFYGGHEIHLLLGKQSGKWKLSGTKNWIEHNNISFSLPNTLYKLPIGHWFYDTDEFKRAKKPDDANLLADYSDDELQDQIKSMQAEIERRKAQDDEITILARKVCVESFEYTTVTNAKLLNGEYDDYAVFKCVKDGIIAGMKLQKRREV